MRSAIYARTACSNQGRNPALALQMEALRGHAAQRGRSIVGEFTDEGYSGLRRDRPGLEGMRNLAERHGFDVLLICDPERLARDSGLQIRMLEELERFGVRTIFVEDANFSVSRFAPAWSRPRAFAESTDSSPRS